MSEEIKMITETLQNLSGTAMWGFVAYLLVAKVFVVTVCWAGGITLACIVIKGIKNITSSCVDANNIVKQLRNGLNIGSSGCLSYNEIEKVEAAIPKLIASYKQKAN